jgi:hypothetical protein
MTKPYAHLAPQVTGDAVRLLDANEARGKTLAKRPKPSHRIGSRRFSGLRRERSGAVA